MRTVFLKIYMAGPLILGKSMASEIRSTGVGLIAILVQIFKVGKWFSQSMTLDFGPGKNGFAH
jgi:hypothetical protein